MGYKLKTYCDDDRLLVELGAPDWHHHVLVIWDGDYDCIVISASHARRLMRILPDAIRDCDNANKADQRRFERRTMNINEVSFKRRALERELEEIITAKLEEFRDDTGQSVSSVKVGLRVVNSTAEGVPHYIVSNVACEVKI